MLELKHYYPKVEYPGLDFLEDTSIIRNLIFAIQQVTIMQGCLIAMKYKKVLELVRKNA